MHRKAPRLILRNSATPTERYPPGIYYFLFALPALVFLARQLFASFGISVLEFQRGSVLGSILREYVHASGLAYPLLLIIMYIGALPAGNPYVRRLMRIRKELSIISGFPVLIHVWVRWRMAGPVCDFFFGGASGESTSHTWVAGLAPTACLLGVVMAVLFLILWVTSFDAIHKRLGAVRWKKIQQWAYPFYALLFAHSVLLSAGRLLNGGGHGGREPAAVTLIGLITTCLLFGSYLILRLRKRRQRVVAARS